MSGCCFSTVSPPPANHQGTSAALPFASAAASFLAAATLPAGSVGRCGMVWNFGGTKFFGSFLVGG